MFNTDEQQIQERSSAVFIEINDRIMQYFTFKYLLAACCLAGFFASCHVEDPLEQELYQKEVYLVGAAEPMQVKDVSYAGTGELYVSAAIGGSQFSANDVEVEIGVASNDRIDAYNRQNVVEGQTKYEPMPTTWYHFPQWKGVIKAGEVYCRIPLTIDLTKISPDARYFIPLKIISVSSYSKVQKDSVLLLHPHMINDYAGTYNFSGTTVELKNGEPDYATLSVINILRTAVAVDGKTIRLFHKASLETNEQIASSTYTIMVNEDQTLTLKTFDQMEITDGGGSFSKSTGAFSYWYIYKENGKTYKMTATLTKPQKEI